MANAPAVTDKELRMSYRIGRGETGVLSFEPYKSYLLPKWRFRTPELARESSQALYRQFLVYQDKGDFVGMDSGKLCSSASNVLHSTVHSPFCKSVNSSKWFGSLALLDATDFNPSIRG